ncbi:MAG: hypothetical protein Q7K37_04190 [Dehalococcoidia bacterium]|nr:hypothetical protein [Dehalococcoidia bacterium]
MNRRDLDRALSRWRDHDLLSEEQAHAIAAFEAVEQGESEDAPLEERPGLAAGSMLAYAGVLVALGAVLGLYVTVLSDAAPSVQLGISWLIVAVGLGLTYGASRLPSGAAMADALGFATALLVGWASMQTFDVAGWLDDRNVDEDVRQMRMAWMLTGVGVAAVGWLLARRFSPMAALAASVATVWTAAAVVWVFAATDREGPGTVGGQAAVIVGFALALVGAIAPKVIGIDERARTWLLVGALGAANVAAFIIAVGDGGVFEGLLLAYAIGLGVAALGLRSRVILVFAAITLYEYVGVVVFRTFEGAVAAIIILALVGLGTAIGGTLVQRGLADRFVPHFR